MTRFVMTLEQSVELIKYAIENGDSGDTIIPELVSMNLIDLLEIFSEKYNKPIEVTSIRPGEKMHEQMIGIEDAAHTFEYDSYYKILPAINNWSSDKNRIGNGKSVQNDFQYTSDNNKEWMSLDELRSWISENHKKFIEI